MESFCTEVKVRSSLMLPSENGVIALQNVMVLIYSHVLRHLHCSFTLACLHYVGRHGIAASIPSDHTNNTCLQIVLYILQINNLNSFISVGSNHRIVSAKIRRSLRINKINSSSNPLDD